MGAVESRPIGLRTTPESGARPGEPDHRGLVMGLAMAVSVMAAVAAAAGLAQWGAGADVTATSVRGETVDLVGDGLYRHDTLFARGGQLGNDFVILVLGVPLLLVTAAMYRQGSRLGHLGLGAVLAVFLYVYGSVALGTVAYNPMFLVYVAILGASLWAFVLTMMTVDGRSLPVERLPRRAVAGLMLASAGVLAVIWGGDLLAAVVTGDAPARLDTYATPVTHALDLAVLAPAAAGAGVLVLRGRATGYVTALPVMAVGASLLPFMIAQTVGQLSSGVTFPVAEVAGILAGFAVISVASAVVLVAVLREVSREAPPRPPAPGTG